MLSRSPQGGEASRAVMLSMSKPLVTAALGWVLLAPAMDPKNPDDKKKPGGKKK
jgi:hypothetical protein